MPRLAPRVEPLRCLRARRPDQDFAAHLRREFLMVRPDPIEPACDFFPCTQDRIRRLCTWASFAAAHATRLGCLSFTPPPISLVPRITDMIYHNCAPLFPTSRRSLSLRPTGGGALIVGGGWRPAAALSAPGSLGWRCGGGGGGLGASIPHRIARCMCACVAQCRLIVCAWEGALSAWGEEGRGKRSLRESKVVLMQKEILQSRPALHCEGHANSFTRRPGRNAADES